MQGRFSGAGIFAWVAMLASVFSSAAIARTDDGSVAPTSVRADFTETSGTRGYFRVGKDKSGRWWFVTPDDKPFFFRGVTSVAQDGWATKRPDGSSYDQVIKSTYGEAAFPRKTAERLRQWGFNALGAWSGEDLWDKSLPFTVICNFSKGENIPLIDGTFLPDVFDPAWEKQMEETAKTLCGPRQNSRLLLGYFTDNELSWAQARTEDKPLVFDPSQQTLRDKNRPSLLQLCLSLAPSRPANTAAWAWIKKRHSNSLAKIGESWGVAGLDREARIGEWTKAEKAILSPGYVTDDEAWSREFAARYFQRTAQAIRKYDKNHLILGCRFGAPPGPAVLGAMRRPDVDVVSANNYRDTFYERMDIYARGTGLPVLNTEFAWVTDYFTKLRDSDGKLGEASASRMLVRGRASLEQAISHPQLVGYTWYRWVDKADFVPPISYGLVSVKDAPNQTHLSVLETVHARADALHSGVVPPVRPSDSPTPTTAAK